MFGPPEAAAVIREAVAPLADLGVAGAIATTSRRTGGTDSTSFNAAGLPGIGTTLDPIEYQSATWHTNLDTYERIVEDDVKKSAIVIATTVYALAMRDEALPRFTKEAMPKPDAPPASPETKPATPAGAEADRRGQMRPCDRLRRHLSAREHAFQARDFIADAGRDR